MLIKKIVEVAWQPMVEHQRQPYDSTLKALLREQAAEMIPYLVEEAEFIDTLDSEVLKPQPPLRSDRAYRIQYRGEPHVLHIELETGANSRMAYRMLSYHCTAARGTSFTCDIADYLPVPHKASEVAVTGDKSARRTARFSLQGATIVGT